MHMLLDLEHLILSLQIHADGDIQGLVLIGQRVVIGILHITSCELVPLLDIHVVLHEVGIKVLYDEVFTLQVHNRTLSPLLVNQHDRIDSCFLCHKGIVSTEVRSDMHDTGTIVGRDIITGNHLEGVTHRFDGRHQLLILHADEVRTFVMTDDLPRDHLVTSLIGIQVTVLTLFLEIGVQTCLCHHDGDRLCGIGVKGLHGNIVDLRTNA